MFNDPSAHVLRMIQRAAKIYKHRYGDYPEAIGLDIFTRFREWQETNHLDAYHFREVERTLPRVCESCVCEPYAPIVFTNIAIKVDPVTFSPVEYDEHRLNPRPTDPKQGQNTIHCKRGEHEVVMDLILTESGYHVVICEKSEWLAWQESKTEEEEMDTQRELNSDSE
jgi:hypothetical protein